MKTLSLALACVFASIASASEPFGWRGNGTGSFASSDPPTSWSRDTNVVWKVTLPAGYNSPAYAEARVFVTASPALLVCLDAGTGQELWRATADYEAALGAAKAAEIKATHERFEAQRRAIREPFERERKLNPQAKESDEIKQQLEAIKQQHDAYEKQYPRGERGGTGNVAATPVTDGQGVYAVFATGIVAGYTTNGERLWVRHVAAPPPGFGHSASPVIADGKLIVHLQDMIALDLKSGEEQWRATVPPKHGSSVVSQIGGEPVVITPAGAIVQATDGKVLAEKLFSLSDNSPLVHEGVIYAHQTGSVVALQLPQAITEPLEVETLWEARVKGDQRMTSAAYHGGLLYAGNRRGILDVLEADTGKLLYQKRLSLGELFPSVAATHDYVFITGKEGKTVVLKPGPDYQEVATCELEGLSSSPIFVGNRLYVRTDKALYCIASQGAKK